MHELARGVRQDLAAPEEPLERPSELKADLETTQMGEARVARREDPAAHLPERYASNPRAEIVDYRDQPNAEKRYPQDGLRRISGQLRATEVLAEGRLQQRPRPPPPAA